MTPTKLLIGQILIVFAILIAGVWAATQWAAAMLAYQPELGAPWAIIGGLPVYRLWALFAWWYHYDAYAPAVFDKAGTLAGASGFIGCGAAIAGSLCRARQSNNVTTYGSARWANGREIDAAGLHKDAGVLLGSLDGRYLRHDGPSMSWRSHRLARARASASSSRFCCLGPDRPSFMTSRARTGR